MFKKRGLSTIVATLLILLLVFVAVGILWVVIRNVIVQGTEQVSLGKFTLDLKIEQVSVNANNVSVKIKRNPGEGEISGLKIIISDGDNTQTFTTNGSIKINERKTYSFVPTEIDISKIEKVQIAPVFTLSSGKIIVGDIKDEWEKSSATGIGGVVEIPNEENSNVGSECLVDSNCTGISNSGNYCSVDGNSAINNYNYFCNASKMCQSSSTTSIVENCSATGKVCSSGNCVAQTPQCSSHSYSQCYSNDIYWYNSCNVREEIKTDCSATENCANNRCVAQTSSGNEINVIGPHEFWTHTNAQNGDYVGYVKYFDMIDFTPEYSIVSGNNGAFAIGSSSGLITISNKNLLSSGTTYTLGVRIKNSAGTKDSTANVAVHVADGNNVKYFDGNAGSGGDGSYNSPYNDLQSDVGTFTRGIYLLKRGTTFEDKIFIKDSSSSSTNPIVVGAYGQGNRPVIYGANADARGISIEDDDDTGTPVTGYVYVQNLEVSYWGNHNIYVGGHGPHDVYFLDIYVHHTSGDSTNWWMWEDFENPTQDLNIFVVNSETAYAAESGTKWYPGGLEIYNMKAHDNGGNGLRIIAAPEKICKGCVAYDNYHTGIQLRSTNTLLEYFKSYNNGYTGLELGIAPQNPPLDAYTYRQTNFVLRHGIIADNNAHGATTSGYVSDITYDDVKIYGNGWSGFTLHPSEGFIPLEIKIINSEIHDNSQKGIAITGSNGELPGDVLVKDNEISNNGEEGVFVEYADNVRVINNIFSGNSGEDILEGEGATNFQQSGNQFL